MHQTLQVCVIMSVLFAGACGGPTQNSQKQHINTQAVSERPNPQSEINSVRGDLTEAYKIVMLGDSLTAGFGLAQDQALPERLEQELINRGIGVELINAGVSGDTTGNGLSRYDWSVGSLNANMVIIALGGNDYIQGVAPSRIEANLKQIIGKAQDDGLKIVVAGIETRSPGLSGRESVYGRVYENSVKATSAALYPALLQGVRDNPSLLQRDGLHPTAEGVEIMASNLADFLMPILKSEL